MSSKRTRSRVAALAALAVLMAGGPVLAHDDDPKVRSRVPRYEGPGYRGAEAATSGSTAGTSFEASGLTLLAWLPIGEISGDPAANDCWGYVSPSGREYALLGLFGSTAFIDVSTPDDPVIVDVIDGVSSLWRDVKTYQNYAYAVSEGGGGIQVFDLADIDNGNVSLVNTVTSGPGDSDTHNVAIDTDSGFLYRCGGTNQDGLRIYDLANPANPAFVGEWNTRYVHDAQVVTYTSGPFAGRQIAITCGGFNGGSTETGIDILDVTDKSNIVPLDRLLYPNGVYSHQAWLSDDRQYLYLNDERDENGTLPTTTYVIDVSDLTDISFVSTFTNGNSAVGHNLYVRNGLIYEANYRSGLRVFDATSPTNPTEIAYFDTWPDDDIEEFNGLWSVYPFLPSGTIIGSDIERGLFVWRLGDPLVDIALNGGAPEFVDPAGEVVSFTITENVPGGLVPGSPMLSYAVNGGTTTTVALTSVGGDQYEASLPSTSCGSTVKFNVTVETSAGFNAFAPGPGQTFDAISAIGESVAFADNGETDPGWTVNNIDLEDGGWDRGVPVGGGDRGDPATDFDGSGRCWLTDNEDGNSDVDGGPTQLISPVLDLTGLADPALTYARWMTSSNGSDVLVVSVSADGTNWVDIETVGNTLGWIERQIRVADHLTSATSIQVRFSVADDPEPSVAEAAVDAIAISEFICPGTGTPEDVDNDGDVDFGDVLQVLSAWGPCGAPCPQDVNGNGSVDFQDLLAILSAWNG